MKKNADEAMKISGEPSLVNFFEMLQDENLDGVVIATPSAMYAALSIEALKEAVFVKNHWEELLLR